MHEKSRISVESQVYLLLREQEICDSSTTRGKIVMRMKPEPLNGIPQTSLCYVASRQAGRSGRKPPHSIPWLLRNLLATSSPELGSGIVLQGKHTQSNWG